MRRARKKLSEEGEVDMTPMLDIVFIMLIFFIVTAVFLDEEGIDVTQPPPPPEQQNPPDSPPAITVYVNDNNLCSVDGIRTTCDGVLARVERQLADKAGASVILRFHPKSQNRILVQLRDELDGRGLKSKIEVTEDI
jgi:biopolymer transport protein ExbD